METIIILDDVLSNTARLFFLALGLWGLFRAIRGQGVDGNYLGTLAIGQILYILMLVFDGILWFRGVAPDRAGLHYLYAIFAVLLIPFVYASVLKGEDSNQAQWIYAFVALFLFGIAARAMTTAL